MDSSSAILAFDCSGLAGSVALRVGDTTHRIALPQGQQAGQLVAAIDRLLRSHAVAYPALTRIVTTTGPGSFTGLRIALATLHGLLMVHPTPLSLLTSTEAAAWSLWDRARVTPPHSEQLTIALNAGKGEVFRQSFTLTDKGPTPRDAITLHPRAEVGTTEYSDQHPPEHPYFMAGVDAAPLATYGDRFPLATLAEAKPYYIRPADAKPPAPMAWLSAT